MSTYKIESVDQALAEVDYALAEIFSKPHLIATKAEPSLPDVDRAALAAIFSEPLPITNNTEPSPPRFDHHALAEIFGDRHRVPIDPKPSPLSIDEGSSAALSEKIQNGEPVANIVAAAPPTITESTRPQRAESLLDKIRCIFSTKAETLPSSPDSQAEALSTELRGLILDSPKQASVVENGPSRRCNQLTELEPAVQTFEAVLRADAARPHHAQSLPIEALSPTSTTEPSFLLAELPDKISADAKSPLVIGEKEPSCSRGSSRAINLEPATSAFSSASSASQGAAIQSRKTKPLQSDAPSPPLIFEDEPSSLSSHPKYATSPAGAVESIPSNSSNTDSSPIFQEQQPAPHSRHSAGYLEPPAAPTDLEIALPSQAKLLQAETLESFLEETPSQPIVHGRHGDFDVGVAAVSTASSMGDMMVRQPQAKPLLAQLELETAIRLRWVMRDIRANRTAMSPASENDLAKLVELGLVEMREKLPGLTALGIVELY